MKPNGRKIEILMAQQKLSQTELCRRAGVTRPTMTRVRNGYDARPETLGVIADALGVSVTEIIEEG